MSRPAILSVLVLLGSAPGCAALEERSECSEVGGLDDKRGKAPLESGVFGGTELPTQVPLSPGQIQAVGSFAVCSGTLIADDWVLTAQHCLIEPGNVFCVGEQPDAPDRCLAVARSIAHPEVDARLVQLAAGARSVAPGVEPVPPMTEELHCGWMGQVAEAAGYGLTEAGEIGTRLFTAEPIVKLTPDRVRIHGRGLSGLCNGDSGGPVFVVAADGSVRVAGALSVGHLTCREYDDFTRVDAIAGWIADETGLTLP